MKTITKWSAVGLLIALAASVYAPTASAHGEKSQAAFMRMRTIHWYDLKWSKEAVNVNEEVEITGKFHVFEGWPETVADPDDAFLNIGIPGPVFIRKDPTSAVSWCRVPYVWKWVPPTTSAWF